MEIILELLSLEFVQRSLLVLIAVSIACGLIGVVMMVRGSVLMGDALSHASLTGVATALLLGVFPLAGALVYALFLSLLLTWVRHRWKVNIDTLIGLLLPVSMGVAVILMSYSRGYQPELVSYLFGSLLTVTWAEAGVILSISLLVLLVFLRFRQQLIFVHVDEDYAKLIGLKVGWFQLLYNLLLAVSVVVAVKAVGVVLANTLLIIPSAIAQTWSRSTHGYILLACVSSLAVSLLGFGVGFALDWPVGPSIAVTAGLFYSFGLLLKQKI